MRRTSLPLAAATAVLGSLLLTACGTQEDVNGSSGNPPAGSTASAAPDCPAPDGESGPVDGVRLTGAPRCENVEITNTTGTTATYFLTFQVTSNSGAALSISHQTISSVSPGASVRQTLHPSRPADMDTTTHLKIIQVRSVPTAEAPTRSGPCPASGVYLYSDDGNAAMGLRVVGLHLYNCGTRPYTVDGYPQLQILDADHRPIGTVRILQGGNAITPGTGADGPARPLTLKPGEGAHADLVWHNTTGLGSDPVNAPYVRVVPKPGGAPVTVVPELDLGTTGKLAVGPWKDNTP
jgi:hypothetical protein